MILLIFFVVTEGILSDALNFVDSLSARFRNNACPTYFDYYLLKVNPNCYYSPDITIEFGVILSRYFKDFSKHNVTTEDGYILNLYRIPQNNSKGAIIMQNPLGADGLVFVALGKTSYAYFFYQQGYEIWLSSTRGTDLSPDHITLSQADPQFWDWSYAETGKYDTRSVINYVRGEIGPDKKLIFLGYSQSGADVLIYSSLYPEEAQKNIDLSLLLAPGGFYIDPRTPIVFLSGIGLLALDLIRKLRKFSVLQQHSIETKLARAIFKNFPDKRLIFLLVDVLAGFTPSQDDPNLLYTTLTLYFRGSSIKNTKFYLQQAHSKKFQMYDYGKKKNLKYYGTNQPPEYPVENITTPIYIFAGKKDLIVSPLGVKQLHSRLSADTKIFGGLQFIDDYNHADFGIGKNRVTIYKKMLEILNKL